MDMKEKLVELQLKADLEDETSENTAQHREYIADLMIAHGVTVQDNMEISEELLKQLKNAPITILQEEPIIEVVQEWISVKDRLPDAGGVLCITKGGHYKVLEWLETFRCWSDPGGIDFRNFRLEYITHWMPLPQPPKGE